MSLPVRRGKTLLRYSAGLGAVLVLIALSSFCFRDDSEARMALLREGMTAIRADDQRRLDDITKQLDRQGSRGEREVLAAQIALLNRQYEEAIRQTHLADRHAPQVAEFAAAIRIEAFYHAGRLADAEAAALKWLATDSDQPVAHRWLAAIYYDLGAMNQAEDHLLALIQTRPDDPAPRQLLGLIYHDYERFDDAVGVLRGLLQLPDLPQQARLDASLRLADSLIRLHRHQEALVVLQPIDDSPVAAARTAECLFAVGEADRARSLIVTAAANDPGSVEILGVLARIQLDDADYSAAEDSLTSLLEVEPSNVQAHYNLAQCYRLAGRKDDAERQ